MERRYNRLLKKRRRSTFIRRTVIFMVLLVLLFVLIIYPFLNISVKSYEIIKEKLPASFNNYKILQISDLYLKGTEKLSKIGRASCRERV